MGTPQTPCKGRKTLGILGCGRQAAAPYASSKAMLLPR